MKTRSGTQNSSTGQGANASKKWRFWIDRGGTFTDVIGMSPDGPMLVEKRPSSDGDGGLSAARSMLGLPEGAPLPAARVAEIRIGSTIATNALLERKGEKIAVAVTRGFADALLIGDQTRPDLFALENRRAPPIWTRAVEIDERIGASGAILIPLDVAAARRQMRTLANAGFRSLAVALMHGFAFPKHERQLARIAKDAGIPNVVASSDASPLVKFIPRACTAAADAYLDPAVRRFVRTLEAQCERGIRLLFMQSSGALIGAGDVRAVHTIMSGPAGGAVGARKTATVAGFSRVIGLDMGGTSADLSLGGAPVKMENRVAGVPFFAPMLDIHTVAAGGGSIVRIQDGRLLAGPDSAGAAPGPACYGNGGPPTITDCNVILGKLQPDFFPEIFGKRRNRPLNEKAAQKKFAALSAQAGFSAPKLAEGFARVAVEAMAGAARRISTARGVDPAACVLNSFGGAAGQHVCEVAEAAGTARAMVSRSASVLSAWGIGAADIGALRRRSVKRSLSSPKLAGALSAAFAALEKDARGALPEKAAEARIRRGVICRYAGAESDIVIPWRGDAKLLRSDFERRHRALFGYRNPDSEVLADAAEAEALLPASAPAPLKNKRSGQRQARAVRKVFFSGKFRDTPFYDWGSLPEGARIDGPAVVLDKWNTAVVSPGWSAQNKNGALLLRHAKREKKLPVAGHARPAPAMLEIFNNRYMAAAEQMGEALRRSAASVNIRERLDYSCALFDRRGMLVANAPHIPVHLGSMGESVRHLILQNPPGMQRGDVFMLNSPYHGGTHLPDITVIKPGFFKKSKAAAPDYFLAARGHHADVGGVSPGSMPAASMHIDEEGALIPLTTAVARGKLREDAIARLLRDAKHPARNIRQNMNDLRAQIAALETGASEMRRAAEDFGESAAREYMRHVQNSAARACLRLLKGLKGGRGTAQFDDGAEIHVRIQTGENGAVFDFSGTSPQHPRNFNAPRAVAHAAVIYCLRVLLGGDMPLNDGIMRPVKLVIPKGCMLNPRPPAAVAAGNVEVSQHIVDAVFAALGACAHGQGTCNNFTLECGGAQYYETVCGGSGAGPSFNGADAMQVHMTNSRATDPEVLESALPLLLETFAFRRDSGGSGRKKGGMGAVRRIKFLSDGEASILSSRRKIAPRGGGGGLDGTPGRNAVLRASGKMERLPGCAQTRMEAGDTFIIQTPGGGGWGRT